MTGAAPSLTGNRSTAPRREPSRWPEALLERVYRRPRWALWNEDWDRHHHHDLPAMSDSEIAIEISCVWRRITMERPPGDDWLWQRRSALFAERDRRRGGRR